MMTEQRGEIALSDYGVHSPDCVLALSGVDGDNQPIFTKTTENRKLLRLYGETLQRWDMTNNSDHNEFYLNN